MNVFKNRSILYFGILVCLSFGFPGISFAAEDNDTVSADDLTQEEVLIDLTDAQQVQTLVVNNLVMPVVEEEEEEEVYYTLSSQELLENLPNRNVVIFQGTFDSENYYLIIPGEYKASLFVSETGSLFNVSDSNITGRLFSSDSLTLSDWDYELFTLSSVLASAGATATYRYGFPSYMTTYEPNDYGNSLSASNVYGTFTVVEEIAADQTSTEYDTFLLVLVLVIIQGFMLVFSWLRISKN